MQMKDFIRKGFEAFDGIRKVNGYKDVTTDVSTYDLAEVLVGCSRKLWLKKNKYSAKEKTYGELMRIMNARQVKQNVLDILDAGGASLGEACTAYFDVSGVEVKAHIDAVVKGEDGSQYGVLIYTVREGAFKYLDVVKDTHYVNAQLLLLNNGLINGIYIFYADREGENAISDPFFVEYDSRIADKVIDEAVNVMESEEAPDPVEVNLKYKELKSGELSVELSAWQCDRCDYYGVSCEGTLPEDWLGLGVIAKIDPDKGQVKVDNKKISAVSEVEDIIKEVWIRDAVGIVEFVKNLCG